MGLTLQSPPLHNTKADFLFPGLHLLVLWNFAVAQPLFDLFSRTAEFFVLRQSPALDIVLFAILLSVVVPALGVLVVWGIRIVDAGLSAGLHLFLVGGLSAMLALQALQMLQTLPHVSGVVLMLGAGGVGLLASVGYHLLPLVRTFCTLLSPGIALFPTLFLFFSPVSMLLFSSPVEIAQVKIKDPPPIVLVIFDEFSSISLMDENRQIDARRYPNFAALAKEATWFRNASSMSAHTVWAIPAILTGSYPTQDRLLPNVSVYPHNIFTLLGGTYTVRAHGTITELCPHELCNQLREPWNERMRALFSDVGIVYLHILLPEDQQYNLPSLQARWKDFGQGSGLVSPGVWKSFEESLWAQVNVRADRPQVFRNFLGSIQPTRRPTLFYLHSLLPHIEYSYLPSGQVYSADGGYTGLTKKETWRGDEWATTQSYQRHLLQVGLVDTLVGELIARLKSAGLYEKSLIVLTSDHGVSFRPYDNRRAITKTNFVDIMAVPLFVKAPFQQQGDIQDHNVEITDILPTIADILDIQLPWPVDGSSAFPSALAPRTEKASSIATRITQDRFHTAILEAVKKKADLFSPGAPVVPKAAPPGLVGRRIRDVSMSEDARLAITIDQSDSLAQVDPAAPFLPIHITGTLYSEEFRFLALALNGTIRAVTQPWSFVVRGKNGKWSALLDPQLLQSGKNTIEAFGVVALSDRVTLVRGTGSPEHLPVFEAPGETIITPNSDSQSLTPSDLEGWVDRAEVRAGHLELAGWAVDVERAQKAKEIWVYVDNEFFHTGGLDVARPDVAQHFGNPAFQQSGFRYTLPLNKFQESPSLTLRVFAVSEDGHISELQYPPLLRDAPAPAIRLHASDPSGPAPAPHRN